MSSAQLTMVLNRGRGSIPLKFIPAVVTFEISALSKFLKYFSSSAPLDHYVDQNHLNSFDLYTFYSNLLDSSIDNKHLTQVHAQLVKTGVQDNTYIATKFIHTSSELGEIYYAGKVFEEISEPNVFLWNAITRGYSRHNLFNDALKMYSRLQIGLVSPEGGTLPYVFKASSGWSDLKMGQLVHSQIFKLGFESDVFVQNALVSLYAKCGHARVVFDGLLDKDILSSASIGLGYVLNGQPWEALKFFRQMRRVDVSLDWVALVSFVKARFNVDGLKLGKSVHSCLITMGIALQPNFLTALTAMYAEYGEVRVASMLFSQIKVSSLFLWDAMISGYATNGYADEAVEIFRMMLSDNVTPDTVVIKSAIRACAQVGSLELCMWMDDLSKKSRQVDVNICLIEVYAKLGSIGNARKVFNRTPKKDVAVWNAMILSYGHAGRCREAINLFQGMERLGMKLNDATYLGILLGCKALGWIKEGMSYFLQMRDVNGIVPRMEHYVCMVDLLCGGGFVDEAYEFIISMPVEPGVTVWRALLSASGIHLKVKLGEYAAHQVLLTNPFDGDAYVEILNLYTSLDMRNHAAKVEIIMREKRLSKDLGYSLLKINGKAEAFRMGDWSHPKSKQIYEELDILEKMIKESGFLPNNEYKEELLCNHSAKLAIAYGILSTPNGTTIRLMKSCQACGDCHSSIKVISKLVGREIVVLDSNRFHHFKDGFCSCEPLPRRSQ